MWDLSDEDVDAVEEVLGEKALKTKQIQVSRGYSEKQLWELDVDEQVVLDHLVAEAELHAEEAVEAKKTGSVEQLKKWLEQQGGNASERHKALKVLIDAGFKRGKASLAAIDGGGLDDLEPVVRLDRAGRLEPRERGGDISCLMAGALELRADVRNRRHAGLRSLQWNGHSVVIRS